MIIPTDGEPGLVKILVFCSDTLPLPGLPTSGGGLRCWQLINALENAGHDVVPSMPLFTYFSKRFDDQIPDAIRQDAWDPTNQDALVEKHRPQAVLFTSTWLVDHLHGRHDCLRIHDLDGPQMLEILYKREPFPHRHLQEKIRRLARSDYVFVAGDRQRYFFFPFLMLAGFSADEMARVPVIPVSFSTPLEPPMENNRPTRRLISAGGFYPWQDPSVGMRHLAQALKNISGVPIEWNIFGKSHSVTGDDDIAFEQLKGELTQDARIQFHDFVTYDNLIAQHRLSDAAIELHMPNPERELAVTTRTLECLRCGVPVLYNNFGELSQPIEQFEAGWTVDPRDQTAIGNVVETIIDNPAECRRRGGNAQRLIEEKFNASLNHRPLLEFLSNPVSRPKSPAARVVDPVDDAEQNRQFAQWNQWQDSRVFKALRKVSTWRNQLLGTGSNS